LIGRRVERERVSAHLRNDAVRLVTLIGPGGVGKTRLAVATADHVGDAFADGRVFVGLAPLRDPGLVLSGVASALGLRETARRRLADVMFDFLRGREMLLILDNFEHLLEAAPLAADILAAAPRVKILATSRAALRVRGEHEYPVPPLDLPPAEQARDVAVLEVNEAVAFFVDRAQAVRPNFALTSDNAAAIAEICARLDGLPLALELAAARVKLLPPATLLTRLGTRLPLLVGGSRDAPQRQRTLRDTIAWSHDLLSQQEQALFRRLAVFVGGWTLEAAEAVADLADDVDVLTGLDVLADQSLIRLDESGPEPRYRMLETIREFADDRLVASGEESAMRHVHAAYFRTFAEQGKPFMYGVNQRVWMRRFESEQPNFRAALETFAADENHDDLLRLAANLGLFWFLHAHFAEGRAQLERALARAVAPTADRAEALLGVGRIAACQDDFIAAETWLRQSEDLARALDLPAILWQAIFQRGMVAEWESDDDRANSLYESALAVARELNDAQAVGVVLYALGDTAYRRGDLPGSERFCEESVALLRGAGDEWALGLSLTNLGAVALARSDVSAAIASFQESLALGLGVDADWVVACALAGFAAVASARGDHTAAARLLGATETLREASHQGRLSNYFHHAQTRQTVRAALGEAAFAAAWEEVRALPADEAIDLPQNLGLLEGRILASGSRT
jgi:predicted ATPase